MKTIHQNNKPRLIIISDLWGREKSDWLPYYTALLEKYFDLCYYDSCELGAVNKSEYTEENLHAQFVNGGIEKAVTLLLQKEKDTNTILGFSIGGSIAWKASLLGLKAPNFFAVSSTRLRYESNKPSGTIRLFYGENDAYQPTHHWFKNMALKQNLFESKTHECYKQKEIAQSICIQILEHLTIT
ncbi:alpha/beta hydrolase [Flavobacterium sp.]